MRLQPIVDGQRPYIMVFIDAGPQVKGNSSIPQRKYGQRVQRLRHKQDFLYADGRSVQQNKPF
jgi:hypothetical protein